MSQEINFFYWEASEKQRAQSTRHACPVELLGIRENLLGICFLLLWVLEISLRLSGLPSKHVYLMSHLTHPSWKVSDLSKVFWIIYEILPIIWWSIWFYYILFLFYQTILDKILVFFLIYFWSKDSWLRVVELRRQRQACLFEFKFSLTGQPRIFSQGLCLQKKKRTTTNSHKQSNKSKF